MSKVLTEVLEANRKYAADFAELRVNDAIDQLSYIRAQVGAQSV